MGTAVVQADPAAMEATAAAGARRPGRREGIRRVREGTPSWDGVFLQLKIALYLRQIRPHELAVVVFVHIFDEGVVGLDVLPFRSGDGDDPVSFGEALARANAIPIHQMSGGIRARDAVLFAE